jgi:hypothetical protein
MNGRRLLLHVLLAAGAGCSRAAHPPRATAEAGAAGQAVPTAKGSERREVDAPRFRDADPRAWRKAYDFDGDGENDEVDDRFTGGAHCCYRVGVRLSSKKKTTWLPFEMDGGYVYPEDLPDNPSQFSVGRTPDGLPEIRMLIATYNGEPMSLPRSWRERYRINSHHVGISFPKGSVRVRDLPPE